MPQAKKGRNPRVSKGAKKPQCHIHDKVEDWVVNQVRKEVCVNDEPLTEYTDGNHYCLFHLPTKEKDLVKFEEIFQSRLESVKQQLAAIEKSPERKRKATKSEPSYNFRYVWFPSPVNLEGSEFQARFYFSSATFSADISFESATLAYYVSFESATFLAHANFSSATFANVSFISATFLADVDFRLATFSADPDFISAIFSADASFVSATFSADANFSWATFSAAADFGWAIFSATAYFKSVKFTDISQVFFRQTKFSQIVDFRSAVFAGYVAFEGEKGERVFLGKKEENLEAVLDLQNARLEKSDRISFHRVRLCPSWFVNTDSRKMIFTDVNWNNLDVRFRNANIKREIESLENRAFSDPNRLLEIACRQLAANAEENSRYEEAAKFRYMAMETKRLEYKWQGRLWTLNWWYKLTSSYGEDWKWAAVVLLIVILFFGGLYASSLSTFDYGEQANEHIFVDVIEQESDWTKKYDARFHKMNLGEGLVHSLYVAAFQRPEPKAADTLTKFFIILETIFAPLQAALLALAIRRKFMR